MKEETGAQDGVIYRLEQDIKELADKVIRHEKGAKAAQEELRDRQDLLKMARRSSIYTAENPLDMTTTITLRLPTQLMAEMSALNHAVIWKFVAQMFTRVIQGPPPV